MGFNNPGVYEIRPYQAPGLSANSWVGGLEAGAVVKTYARSSPPTDNALWQVALVAGSGSSAEYLIINVHSGYFLTATADGTVTSTPQISPRDASCHWTITSTPTHGYDVYKVNNKVSSRGPLNVAGSSLDAGADIGVYGNPGDGDNCKWYFEPK
ncbi:Uu.00g054650.m01.CDS01 [Anthostomella pinea]|uniref:Uu.00g054650.m01.CDS01 n=1 Tax=Anthostomella pinea TaxID=933095 RepID=A0AAI8VXK3_9PEZI|nr:Uu.00g054650.m01.CDS01 [Anthostomella pinea]